MVETALYRPKTLKEAVQILAADEAARCLAGGQTLVAMMNANLVEPSALVSLAELPGLQGIERKKGGAISVGAMTTHREIALSHDFSGSNAVVREAAAVIAHLAIRNMGTIGGALCHADPGADFPAAVTAAEAILELLGPNGRRVVAASDFFKDYLTTDLRQGEILTRINFPRPRNHSAGHYLKFSRISGDYATASVAVCLAMHGRKCTHIRIALGASGPIPVRSKDAEDRLVGSEPTDSAIRQIGRVLAEASDPVDDVRGSAEYRRELIPVLVERAIRTALSRIERR